MSIDKLSNTDKSNGFFTKAFYKESCMGIVNLALSVPDIHVLAIGPESCLRVLYFRALREGQNERLHIQTMSQNDLASSQHLEVTEKVLDKIISIENRKVKAVIVYISCIDILIGSDFDSVFKRIEERYGIPVKLFKRGPLSKRRITPKERLSLIFSEILDVYAEGSSDDKTKESPIINILGEEKLIEQCQLKTILKNKGYLKLQEFTACESFNDFKNLSKATFSVVTDKFGVGIAEYLKENFKIPYFVASTECSEEMFTMENNKINGRQGEI
jgi:nitrogenase molybdenum-iron protein alpha/beta subunit